MGKFTVNGQQLAKSLQRLQALIGIKLDGVLIRAEGDIVEIHAQNNNRSAVIHVPAECNKKTRCLINKLTLEAVCKNRDKITFTKKDNKLKFLSGRFMGDLLLTEYPDKPILLKLSNSEPSISTDLQERINKAIQICQLQSVYGLDKLSIFIQAKENDLYVGVGDQFHANYIKIVGNAEGFAKPFLLPIEYGNILTSQFKNAGVDFTYKKRHIVFRDAHTEVQLPALQTQDSLLNQLLEIKTERICDIDLHNLNIVLQSSMLNNAKLFMVFKKGIKKVKIQFKSDNGNIFDEIDVLDEIKKSIVLPLDAANFIDLTKKLESTAEISFNKHTVKLRQNDYVGYSQLLQQEES